jgi:hypothetical protein
VKNTLKNNQIPTRLSKEKLHKIAECLEFFPVFGKNFKLYRERHGRHQHSNLGEDYLSLQIKYPKTKNDTPWGGNYCYIQI